MAVFAYKFSYVVHHGEPKKKKYNNMCLIYFKVWHALVKVVKVSQLLRVEASNFTKNKEIA